jgi:hypothetical protein
VIRIAERIGFALYVVIAVALVAPSLASRLSPSTTASPQVTATTAPSIAAIATVSPVASPTVPPTPTPPSRTGSPSPSADPSVLVSEYRSGGRTFAALSLVPPFTLTAPFAGRVTIVTYQFLANEVRVGSNVPSEPFYPYVTLTSNDRRLILRPGALGADVQLVAKDGQTVAAGEAHFTVAGAGASSWRTFYDRAVTAQVIASLAALPSGNEVDPLPLLRR